MDQPYDSPETILREVGSTYAALPWYADEGIAWMKTLDDPLPAMRTTFRTRFERDGRFFFAFRAFDDLEDGTLSSEDGERFCQSYYGTKETDYDEAIASLTGVSSGTAILIPNLLRPMEGALSLLDLEEVRRGDEEEVEGVPCMQILGRHHLAEDTTLWIDPESRLIHQIRMVSSGGRPHPMLLQNAMAEGSLLQRLVVRMAMRVKTKPFKTVVWLNPSAPASIADEEFLPPAGPKPKRGWFRSMAGAGR